MRSRHVVLGLLLMAAALACSEQSQGERCELPNGDKDCEVGLFCTSAKDLRAIDGVDRCCPGPQSAFSDSRCDRSGTGPVTPVGTGGGAGMSTVGTPSGGAAVTTAGTPGTTPGTAAATAGTSGANAGAAGTMAGAANPG